jgi:hypothetical protein
VRVPTNQEEAYLFIYLAFTLLLSVARPCSLELLVSVPSLLELL